MKYISLLRGINVSGKNTIKMVELKSLYESLGFTDIITYIQSGNVVFNSNKKDKAKLEETIEDAIEAEYKFRVPVNIRSKDEFKNIIAKNPFGTIDPVKDGTKFLVTFLYSKPALKLIAELQNYVVKPEQLVAESKQLYLYCPNGYGKSKLSNTFIERKLGVKATTRNWKSVCNLYDLSI